MDFARFLLGIAVLVFLGYFGYQGAVSYMAVERSEEALAATVQDLERVPDLSAQLLRYDEGYGAVADVYASRDYFYRLILGNEPPADALVLDQNRDQAIQDCLGRAKEDCLYPLTIAAGEAARDPFLRDAHLAALARYFLENGELGQVEALAPSITAPHIRAGVYEDLGRRLFDLGQRDIALTMAARAIASVEEAEDSLLRAVATAELASMLIELEEPGRAITVLRQTPAMVLADSDATAPLDQVLSLLRIAATASLVGDTVTIQSATGAIRQIDSVDSGPVPRARVEALLISELARMQGAEAAQAAYDNLERDIDRALAYMLWAHNLAVAGEVIEADRLLQEGISMSQELGVILPAELLVEVVGAQAALGYFPAAQVTLSNIDIPTLADEARYLLARNYYLIGRDEEAAALRLEVFTDQLGSDLDALAGQPPETREAHFASVDMSRRVLRFFRRGWISQLQSFEDALAARDTFDGMAPLAVVRDQLASMDPATISRDQAEPLLDISLSIRENLSPLPVDTMLAQACRGQGDQCRVDIGYLQGYAFRTFTLPALDRLDLAVAGQ
ncbi:MAG: hypothetical protein KI792_11125 [Alphaproteobacteria bacterium]|nr:hypothetical protein [Alphaproteobacteria bacterium SS10]